MVYDPAAPRKTAEHAGLATVKIVLSLPLLAIGLGLAGYGLTFL